MINIKSLSFSYGKKAVYVDFNLSVDGTVIGMIGQNGAGKTTLVNIILGLLIPSRGTISVDGTDIEKDRRSFLKMVGASFEDSEFPSWISLHDYLVFVAQVRGLSRTDAEKEGNALLDRFDLTEYKDKNFQKLSAGMKQKFRIAQAIIGYPRYIFLDEPTANLDVRARADILEYLHDLAWEKGLRIIILSHILHDLEKICDTVVMIHEGRLVLQSSMEELLSFDISRVYRLRCKSQTEITDLVGQLESLHVKNITTKGTTLEFSATTKKLREIEPVIGGHTVSPTRSTLEQIFVNQTGGEIH